MDIHWSVWIPRSIWTCIAIDYKFSWRSHVASICKKVAYYPVIFDWLSLKYFISKSSTKMLVASLVRSHLNIHFQYGIPH